MSASQMQPLAGTENAIQIHNLRFRWNKQSPVVLALDQLDIGKGEQVFIEGPSGSGKSTLLSLLAGISEPHQGELHILGEPLHRLGGAARDHFRAHHIGYIFQMFNLIPYLSMVENVLLPCRFSGVRRRRALRQSQTLESEALRLLSHLDMAHGELLQRRVTELSVGQQQRVAAARALMGAPELLIADEPTSSLDADRRAGFVHLLFEECTQAGSTLVFVSHDTSLEPLFDRTIRLTELNTANPQTPEGNGR